MVLIKEFPTFGFLVPNLTDAQNYSECLLRMFQIFKNLEYESKTMPGYFSLYKCAAAEVYSDYAYTFTFIPNAKLICFS